MEEKRLGEEKLAFEGRPWSRLCWYVPDVCSTFNRSLCPSFCARSAGVWPLCRPQLKVKPVAVVVFEVKCKVQKLHTRWSHMLPCNTAPSLSRQSGGELLPTCSSAHFAQHVANVALCRVDTPFWPENLAIHNCKTTRSWVSCHEIRDRSAPSHKETTECPQRLSRSDEMLA